MRLFFFLLVFLTVFMGVSAKNADCSDVIEKNKNSIYCEAYDSNIFFWVTHEDNTLGKVDVFSGPSNLNPISYKVKNVGTDDLNVYITAFDNESHLYVRISRILGHAEPGRNTDLLPAQKDHNNPIFQGTLEVSGVAFDKGQTISYKILCNNW